MTTATVGVVLAIVGGLVIIKHAARKTNCVYYDFKDLPNELRNLIAAKREER